jgi:hypothetical protein
MEKDYLVLKRASASRTSGEWREDDFDVLADGVVVGRITRHTQSVSRKCAARAIRHAIRSKLPAGRRRPSFRRLPITCSRRVELLRVSGPP